MTGAAGLAGATGYINDIPAEAMSEYGQVLPLPGEEQAWFDALPAALRERLKA